jgi:hypothetical protein
MAYAAATKLTPIDVTRAGAAIELAAADADGNGVPADGHTVLRITNADASPITVTLNITATVDGQAVTNPTVTVAATGDGDGLDQQMIGPFDGRYDQGDGYAWITYSAVTDVTVAAIRWATA